jgi:HAD superfamily hydrolase (TIGR01509 family)
VIFDCDGVLIDSEIISARMLVAELGALGVQIDLPYVARHFLGRSYPTVMKVIRSEFGVDLPEAFEEQYRARLLAAFRKGLTIMPGVRGALEQLALPWCVATSSSAGRARTSLEIVGLEGLVGERLTTAAEVANGKPAPDLFLLAARKMGAEPGHCLVVEDSLNGIRAARAAGMAVWHFAGGSHLKGIGDLVGASDRPDGAFASFGDFFQIDPRLPRKAESAI